MSLKISEFTRIVAAIDKRWPACTVGQSPDGGYYEVREASGNLLVAHTDLGECLRAALALSRVRKP